MYQNKYLKYKNKYLNLKNYGETFHKLIQKGGSAEFDRLAASCLAEITASNQSCLSCKFFHGNNPTSGAHTKKSCTPQDVPIYFYKPEDNLDQFTIFFGKQITNINDEIKYFNTTEMDYYDPILESFLIPEQYRNISSYIVTPDQQLGNIITITQSVDQVSTFCAEGNMVWVTNNSRVGTTGITSCMFVVLLLDNDSKLCIHHTLGDEMDDGLDSGWGAQKNFTHKSYLPQILNQIRGRITGAYFLGNGDYPQICQIYNQYYQPFYRLSGDGHYIIDHTNNLLILKEFL